MKHQVVWGQREPEPEPKPERQLDTAPVDWGAVAQSLIDAAIAGQKNYTERLLASVVAELEDRADEQLDTFASTLEERLVDRIADLITDELDKIRREINNNNKSERGEVIDLPQLPLVRKDRRA
jgi:hypothetical protein